MSKGRFYISTDGNARKYLVPLERREEFRAWADLSEDDEAKWTVPDYAMAIEGELVTFSDPAVGGVPLVSDHRVRVEHERALLHEKLEKLREFCETPMFFELPERYRTLMFQQVTAMASYRDILDKRIELHNQ